MRIAIPYRKSGVELKYCLRGIEKFIDNPEVVIIGDRAPFKTDYIPFKDNHETRFKERNIFQKILLVDEDFIFFNDDHFLLKPFNFEYHYSGKLQERKEAYELTNSCRKTIQNTINIYGNINNYYRHSPLFIEREKLRPLELLDWDIYFGYCLKSIYCHVNNIQGKDYPDLKIRVPANEEKIEKMILGRPYFSTGDSVVNIAMVKVLEKLYPHKSRFE